MPTLSDLTIPWDIQLKPAPRIGGGPGGREGELTFRIARADWPAFAKALSGTVETVDLGNGSTVERIAPLVHPDDPDMVALSYDAEMFGDTSSGSFAYYRVRVQFATLPFGQDGETAYYALTTDTSESFETVPNLTLHFTDSSTVTGEFGIPMPTTSITLTTFLSTTPVNYAVTSLLGRWNSAVFDDFPIGSLRFVGVKSDFSQGSYTRTLVKSYGFQFRAQHWNTILRKDGVWDLATVGGTGVGRFLSADLNLLKYI